MDDMQVSIDPPIERGILVNGDSSTRLTDLIAQATLKYSMKDYDAAAELYSEATELQAKINGELSPQNADLLYAYGRCLYHVAVRNSDVLGSKLAGEKPAQGPKKSIGQKRAAKTEPLDDQANSTAGQVVSDLIEEKEGPVRPPEAEEKSGKPYFQFAGDENFDASDEEDDNEEQDGEDEDADEDDFANAYEILDLARVLLLQKIEEDEAKGGDRKATSVSPATKDIQERLADTYDLQAEISLEGERFSNAVADLRSALSLKKKLFPPDSSLLAEAHYKLSLALEFSSVTQQRNQDGEIEEGKEAYVDYATREEAAKEMEAAVASCKLRIRKEENKLQHVTQSNPNDAAPKAAKKEINDVKEMVTEMEQRLSELRQPPVSVNDPSGTATIDGSNPLAGILGSMLGESPEAQKGRLEREAQGANDLTKLVKRKKPAGDRPSMTPTVGMPQTGKRKAEVPTGDGDSGQGKKTRFEEN
ncbi:MAG: hypothetical protein Q9217_002865 [Psora testacea]